MMAGESVVVSNHEDLSGGIWKALLEQELERNVRLSATIDSLEGQLKQMISELAASKEYESKCHLLSKEAILKDVELDQLRNKMNEMTVALSKFEEMAENQRLTDKRASAEDLESQIEKLLFLYDEKNKSDPKTSGGEEKDVENLVSQISTNEVESVLVSPNLKEVEKNPSYKEEQAGLKVKGDKSEKIKVSSKFELHKFAKLISTNPKSFGCTLCKKTCKRRTNLLIHVEARHVVPGTFTHQCNVCNKTLATLSCLYTHMYSKHKKTESGKRKRFSHINTFQTPSDPDIKLEADITTKPDEETPQEEVNDLEKKKIASKDELYQYCELLPTNTHRCTICGKTCRRKVNVWIHIERAHFPGTFLHQCHVCHIKLTTLSRLYTHMHVKHKKAEKGKKKKSLNTIHSSQTQPTPAPPVEVKLEPPVNTKSREEVNPYDIKSEALRGENIRSRSQLYSFVKLSSTSPFVHKCSLCGKTSKQKQNVWKHVENSHFPGTFSYPCKNCPIVFSTMIKLNSHMSHKHNNSTTVKRRNLKGTTAENGKEDANDDKGKETKENRTNRRKVQMKPNATAAHKSVFGTRRKAASRPLMLEKMKASKMIKVEQDTSQSEMEKVTDKKQLYNFIKASSTAPRTFSCTLCEQKSKRRDNLWIHVESRHFSGTFTHQCNNCASSFPTMSKLYVHNANHTNSRKLKKGGIGGRRREVKDEAKAQTLKPTKVNKVPSPIEEDLSRKPGNIDSDNVTDAEARENDLVEDVVSEKPMEDTITSKDQLYKFIASNPKNGFSCTLCGMRGERKKHLWLHIESIHYPGTFVHTCNHCTETFDTMAKLKGHVQTKHGSFLKKTPDVLKADIKVVENPKFNEKSKSETNIDQEKNDGITSEDELYNYIKLFTANPRSYRCSLCGHTSKIRKNLWVHVENIHFPGKFSHQCSQCPLTFPTKTKMSAHMVKTHNRGCQIKKRAKRKKV